MLNFAHIPNLCSLFRVGWGTKRLIYFPFLEVELKSARKVHKPAEGRWHPYNEATWNLSPKVCWPPRSLVKKVTSVLHIHFNGTTHTVFVCLLVWSVTGSSRVQFSFIWCISTYWLTSFTVKENENVLRHPWNDLVFLSMLAAQLKWIHHFPLGPFGDNVEAIWLMFKN